MVPVQQTAKAGPGIGLGDRRQRSHLTKLAKKAERQAQAVTLPDGSSVYPDAPPGVGWVAAVRGHPLKYLRSRDEAFAMVRSLTGSAAG